MTRYSQRIKKNTELVSKAFKYAKEAHEGQVRKYTKEPYFHHVLNVAQMVQSSGGTSEMIAAAILHDTVEDTQVTIEDIALEFGATVYSYVALLTDISVPSDGNRAARKLIDRQHIKGAPPAVQTIKLADLIDNTKSIVDHDPEFAKVYMMEKAALLEYLKDGHIGLYRKAGNMVNSYYQQQMV